ncbi:MAG TPA: alkaline phosphatase family protein, partial [Burkholderiaceae bacterium]|nr:alkaline phosphatase family protein [Burkholderiaceae bacterium]
MRRNREKAAMHVATFVIKKLATRGAIVGAAVAALSMCATVGRPGSGGTAAGQPRNAIIFVADGLRRGSVDATQAPTLLRVRQQGVDFVNSHALFPTFTTPNAAAIATGHALGDHGDFSNTVYPGFAIFNDGAIAGKRTGTSTPFLENDQVLADIDEHFANRNYLNEESLLALARAQGFQTASVGKLGPVAIQDVTQLNPVGGNLPVPQTVFLDDATGTPAGIPLSAAVQAALAAAGLPAAAPPRTQPAGDVATPGTRDANVAQQRYFADATTKALLPLFKASGKNFVLVFWSRDPDGTQHNQGDSLNQLVPGINGPTSRAAVANADANLEQILDAVEADAQLRATTDVIVTSDHGFATISKHEVDAQGHASTSYSTRFTYAAAHGGNEVVPGWLPPGFL